jgi:hypothetical protein
VIHSDGFSARVFIPGNSCFGRLRQDNSFEDFRDKDVSLHRRQALCDRFRVYTQPKHGPRVARRFGLNHDLSHQGHFLNPRAIVLDN